MSEPEPKFSETTRGSSTYIYESETPVSMAKMIMSRHVRPLPSFRPSRTSSASPLRTILVLLPLPQPAHTAPPPLPRARTPSARRRPTRASDCSVTMVADGDAMCDAMYETGRRCACSSVPAALSNSGQRGSVNKEIAERQDLRNPNSLPFHLKGSFPGQEATAAYSKSCDIVIPDSYPSKWNSSQKCITRTSPPRHPQYAWSPVLTLKSTLIPLQSLICSPEPNDPRRRSTIRRWAAGGAAAAAAPAPSKGVSERDEVVIAGLERAHVERFEALGFSSVSASSRLVIDIVPLGGSVLASRQRRRFRLPLVDACVHFALLAFLIRVWVGARSFPPNFPLSTFSTA
ncbi:hypothetical protein C8R45DRAFT_1216840 [Mycena sanguinolenta]|nr:hypothetical protein C8R45DRAFT_1216840 [Mycena sanguinolenta]